MSHDIEFNVGDRPGVQFTVRDTNGDVVDLSGASVNFIWDNPDGTTKQQVATVTDATNGVAQVVFDSGDIDTAGLIVGRVRYTKTGRTITSRNEYKIRVDRQMTATS